MNGHALRDLLSSTGDGPSDRVAKSITSVTGAGCVRKVNGNDPVVLTPCVHSNAVWLGFRSTWRGKDKVTRVEVLGHVNGVRSTFTGLHLRRTVVGRKHDVARGANRDEDAEFENVVGSLLNGLDGFALRPALDINHESAGVLRGWDEDFEVLGHGLTGVQFHADGEVHLPSER